MTLEETKKVIDKIKIHRLSFGNQLDKSGMENLKLEWFRILEPYDYIDVDRKLDEYFRDGDNEGKYPNPYYLIKYLKTRKEKQNVGLFKIACPLCGCYVDLEDLDGKHYDRCLSTRYIITMRKKCFDKETDIDILSELSDEVFWDKYYEFINILIKSDCYLGKDELSKILQGKDCKKSVEQIALRM